jgi:hypothetical protein
LDIKGNPLTDAATVTERIRRPNYGNLEIEIVSARRVLELKTAGSPVWIRVTIHGSETPNQVRVFLFRVVAGVELLQDHMVTGVAD